MNFGRKLQKTFQLDGLLSAWEHCRRWSHPVDLQPMLAALDPQKLARLRQRYFDPGHPIEVGDDAKWVKAKYWLRVNIERAQDLRLDQRPSLRVLDVGCGAGYFLYVCRRLGHQATGLDIDESPLFRDTLDLLGVERWVGRIEPFVPLPDAGGPYDLVTAHCICFQKIPSPTAPDGWKDWGADEWRFFLREVRTRWLHPGGELLLDFNPRRSGAHYPPEVRALFRQEGAKIFRSKVRLRWTAALSGA